MLKNKQLLLVVNSIKLQLTLLKKPILTLVFYHSIRNLLLIFRVTSFHLGASYRYTVDTRQDDNKMLPLTLWLAFRSLPFCATESGTLILNHPILASNQVSKLQYFNLGGRFSRQALLSYKVQWAPLKWPTRRVWSK